MSQATAIRLKVQKLKTLPPLSPRSQEALAMVNDPEVSLERLSELLETCPSLAARLIGLANSAYFGRCGNVYTVKDAVIKVLGLSVVRGITVSILIGDVLDVRKCKNFQPHKYWFVSVLTGVLTQQLATVVAVTEKPNPEIAYTAGLLFNLGLLALAHVIPGELSDTLRDAEQSGESVTCVLQQRFGFDQYDVGGWLAARWQLPEIFQNVLTGLGDPNYSGNSEILVNLIQVSAQLATELNDSEEVALLGNDSISRLGFSNKELHRVLQQNHAKLEELRNLARMLSGERSYE